MGRVLGTSDWHLGHRNILKYRPFGTIAEHDGLLIKNYREMVGKNDVVWFLGDMVFEADQLHVLWELPGRKKLILGNHDLERFGKVGDLHSVFEQVHALVKYKGAWLSHCPVHPDELMHRAKVNVHGHLHNGVIEDERYINICPEQTNYRPVVLAGQDGILHGRGA